MRENKAQKGNERPSADRDEIRPSSNFNEYLTNVKQVYGRKNSKKAQKMQNSTRRV